VDLLQGRQPAPFAAWLGEWSRGVSRSAWEGLEAHAVDVEVFREALRLKEVGELERADIAATFTDFALQMSTWRGR
jgi:hypothetical protein